jgi:membrane protein implicated in regulation of membrane protease activity
MVVLWVFISKQDRVARTWRTAVFVALRTLPMFVALLLVCRGLHINILAATLVTAVLLWVAFLGSGGVGLGVTGVFYVLQQWILGWPDKQDMMLEPSRSEAAEANAQCELIGQIAVASSALRPAGHIAIGKRTYEARSDLGYIEAGVRVEIIDRKDGSLIVRAWEQTS